MTDSFKVLFLIDFPNNISVLCKKISEKMTKFFPLCLNYCLYLELCIIIMQVQIKSEFVLRCWVIESEYNQDSWGKKSTETKFTGLLDSSYLETVATLTSLLAEVIY